MFGHNKTLVSLKSLVLICGGLNFFSSWTIITIYAPLDTIDYKPKSHVTNMEWTSEPMLKRKVVVRPSLLRRIVMAGGTSHQVSWIAQLASSSVFAAPETNNDNYILWCLVKGDSVPFMVTTPSNHNISQLQHIIHSEGTHGVFSGIDAKDLVLLKVSVFQRATRILWLTFLHFQVAINLDAHDEDSLSHLRIVVVHVVEKLTVWKRVSDYWSSQPPDGQIDIFVEPHDTGEHTPCI